MLASLVTQGLSQVGVPGGTFIRLQTGLAPFPVAAAQNMGNLAEYGQLYRYQTTGLLLMNPLLPTKPPRIEWIDILKGLGIIAVVMGHTLPDPTRLMIFTFHMPLFFILGGLVYRPSMDYKAFLNHKAIHLLIPYLSFWCIFYSDLLVASISHALESPNWSSLRAIATTLFQGIYGGEYLKGSTSTFWFITCFFLTQQVFNYIFTKLNSAYVVIILAGSLTLSYVDSFVLRPLVFPGDINVLLAALPFFGLGVYLQKIQLNMKIFMLIGTMNLIGLCICVMRGYSPAYDMKYADYGIPVISCIFAITMTVLLIQLSKMLSHVTRLKQILIYIGSASMIILYVHQFVQIQVKTSLGEAAHGLRFGISLLVSLLLYQQLTRYPLTRALFLGSVKDVQALLTKNTHPTKPLT